MALIVPNPGASRVAMVTVIGTISLAHHEMASQGRACHLVAKNALLSTAVLSTSKRRNFFAISKIEEHPEVVCRAGD